MAELITAVHVKDPERPGAKPVLFRPGDDVPERFWPAMTNPGLWKDGKPPTGATDQGEGEGETDGDTPPPSPTPGTRTDNDDADNGADPESAKKPAARKAATKPAARRKAADQGTGGQ